MAMSNFTHTYLKNAFLISAEIQTLSMQDDNATQTSTNVSKPDNTTSKTDGNNVEKTKNDASTTLSNGDITFKGRGNTCHTLIVYIKSMGVGWFGSAMTLALMGYIGYVGCLSVSETRA